MSAAHNSRGSLIFRTAISAILLRLARIAESAPTQDVNAAVEDRPSQVSNLASAFPTNCTAYLSRYEDGGRVPMAKFAPACIGAGLRIRLRFGRVLLEHESHRYPSVFVNS